MAFTNLDRIAKRIGSDSYAALSTDAKQRLTWTVESIEQALSLPPWNFRLATTTITEYLPRSSQLFDAPELSDYQQMPSGTIIPLDFDRGSNVLQLSYAPVMLADLEVREDLDGYGGQGPDAFGSGTVLTIGTDYYLDLDQPGLSQSGKLIRIGANWPTVARSIKATYRGGQGAVAASSYGPDFCNVYEECVTACVLHNYAFWEQQRASHESGNAGRVETSESLGKYSHGFGTPSGTVAGGTFQFGGAPELCPAELLTALSSYVNVGVLLAR